MTLEINLDQHGPAPQVQFLHNVRSTENEVNTPAFALRKFITFIAGGEVFAVDMEPVQEIIRLPDIVRVPLAPPALKGLSNLRGRVLPIISLRSIFGFAEMAYDEANRAVVINVGQPLGFVVDCVTNMVTVEPHQVEAVDPIGSSVDSGLLSGFIKDVGGHAMIMVLDLSKLIQREFSYLAAFTKRPSLDCLSVGSHSDVAINAKANLMANDELKLVSIHIADQEYAFAIDHVQEIVQLPDTVMHMPDSLPQVMKVMTLRNRILPLVSLRRMFSLPDKALDEKNRILVLTWQGTSIGVVVDAVNEVMRIGKTLVDPMPSLLFDGGNMADIAEICRLDNGARLVCIIQVHKLFNHSIIKETLNSLTDRVEKTVANSVNAGLQEPADDDEQMVVFRLDKEEFGVPVDSVQEITHVPNELRQVPGAPTFIEGVINLRGSVLPVIDLRLRMRLPRVERSSEQRILVFLIDKLRTGFIVDQVAELLKVSRSMIELSSPLSIQHGKLLTRTANISPQKRILQLLDTSHLVDDDELKSLASIGS
ncbi:Chemotaxis protein CheW [Polaromonas vacuolata]|uniref:Chemotaxis protein CheW n=1 Tax=Polaromonas vacuolata TaxID=37448 RepID=A0A6H2H9N5_9BURK|nr:chemotaxis protein CheW [Polaromonas vacuolata]QJC56196.1 Chemotaxis protein CheW [Polaromonas vacuolata]